MATVGKVNRTGYRQGCGVGGCSSGAVRENGIVGSELSEWRTHTHFSNIRWRSLQKLKLLKEYLVYIMEHMVVSIGESDSTSVVSIGSFIPATHPPHPSDKSSYSIVLPRTDHRFPLRDLDPSRQIYYPRFLYIKLMLPGGTFLCRSLTRVTFRF